VSIPRTNPLTTAEGTWSKRLLKRRQDELAAHRLGVRAFRGPQQERVTVLQLLAELERHYELRDLASLRRLKSHLKHIKAFFGNDRALEVTANRISAYMEIRQQEGAANATINRETEGLQRLRSDPATSHDAREGR
jgi:hypothetical protein